MSTYTHTREAFLLEALLRIHAAREANPDYDTVTPEKSFAQACALADLAEEKGIAPWLSSQSATRNSP